MKESSRVCLTVGILKLRAVRSENGMGKCLIRGWEENETHQLFKCTKTQKWREELLKMKCPNMMEKQHLGSYSLITMKLSLKGK
jgi:hypothetical protein